MKITLLLILILGVGCATATRDTDRLVQDANSLPAKVTLPSVPFVAQTTQQCGPAALAMVMGHTGKVITLDELSAQVFTQKSEGSFKSDMLASVRRQGMLAIELTSFESLLVEVAAERPVVVFQNLGLTWWPQWHYAVVVGYDLSGPDIILHSGEKSFKATDMRLFERSWILGGRWALLVLPPGALSRTASELTHATAAARLESLGFLEQARVSYESILVRWPGSLGALIGLGNIWYQKQEFVKSTQVLQQAVRLHPGSQIAVANLSVATQAVREMKKKIRDY